MGEKLIDLTWSCHICGRVRPDDKISVRSSQLQINGEYCGTMNVHYCNDNPDCVEASKTYSFFNEGLDTDGVPLDLEARVDAMEREIDEKTEEELPYFQTRNCIGCLFADPDAVGTGMPCCSYSNPPLIVGGVCISRKPIFRRN